MAAKSAIILTGATGFIGKAILRELIRQEYPVLILTRHPERIADTSPQVRILTCALENITPEVVTTIQAFAPQTVIHAAWMGTENTNRNDTEFVLLNLQSTLKLFEISVAAGCRRWISFGSQAEYSENIEADIDETMPNFPATAYGITKLVTAHMLLSLAAANGVTCAWLRIFAAYGSEYKASYVMPYLLECFRKQEMPAFKTPHAVWDYIHVDDVAAAILSALQNPQTHGIFNLGTGIGHSIGDIALMMAKSCGFRDMDGLHRAIDQCHDVPTRRVAIIDKIKRYLYWKPDRVLSNEMERANLWT